MTIKEDVDKEIKADEIINTKKRYENKKLVHVNGSCVRVDFQKQIKTYNYKLTTSFLRIHVWNVVYHFDPTIQSMNSHLLLLSLLNQVCLRVQKDDIECKLVDERTLDNLDFRIKYGRMELGD